MKRVKHVENDDSGAAAVFLIGATAVGLLVWLRYRKAQPVAHPAFAFHPRSQAKSQIAATSPTSRPRRDFKGFGYADRQAFGFAF